MFDNKSRFDEERSQHSADYIDSRSQLSKKGIKIVDSWVQRPVGERLPTNLTIKDGFLIPIRNEGPIDPYQYSPRLDQRSPLPGCDWSYSAPRFQDNQPKKSDPPPPTIYNIKGDFDRPRKKIKGFGSARRDLKFPSPNKDSCSKLIPGSNLEDGSGIIENPSFVSMSSLYNMDGEGPYLSVDSADQCYKHTAPQGPSFSMAARYKSSVSSSGPGPGQYDVRYPCDRSVGITIKSRVTQSEKTIIPGPCMYHRTPTLIKPSFNRKAQLSIAARTSPPLQEKNLISNQVAGTPETVSPRVPQPPSNPNRSLREPPPSTQRARARLIYDASSLFSGRNEAALPLTAHQHGSLLGGAARVPVEVDTSGQLKVINSMPPALIDDDASPPIMDDLRAPVTSTIPEAHISAKQVKAGKFLFKSILETTNSILSDSALPRVPLSVGPS